MSQYSINDESHLATLDANLKDNIFIGGSAPNAEDALVLEQYRQNNTEPNQETHLNLWSWYALTVLFQPEIVATWKSVATQKPAPKKEQPKKEEKKPEAPVVEVKEEKAVVDECDDLFGDEPEDNSAMEALKKKQEDAKKDAKKVVVGKSLVIFDIKVWEPQPDDVLGALAERVIAITKPGLVWKTEFQLNDVAYGVKKITIGCVIQDDIVSTEDIIEEVESWEDDVQSVDIAAFNKL
jgi:elongation factor 1-beta